MNNETYLKIAKELISQLEEEQDSLVKTDPEINHKIMFLQTIKAELQTNDHINLSKIEEILNREAEKVKELLYNKAEEQAEEAIKIIYNQVGKARTLIYNQAEKARTLIYNPLCQDSCPKLMI